jgi:quercetin dioxygenase-like cupin family protein
MEEGVSTTKLDFDSGERFQLLRRELGVSSFGMNLMVFQPGGRSRIHRHERQEEVYLVLEGTLTLSVEGDERELGEGELARVAPDVRRQLVNRRRERLAVLALGGDGQHEGRDGVAYTSWEDTEGASPRDVPFPPDLPESELR